MKRVPSRRKIPAARPGRKKPRLDLKISKGLDALYELPEESFSIREKDILRLIKETLSGVRVGGGNLVRADYLNMQKIAKRHGVKLP